MPCSNSSVATGIAYASCAAMELAVLREGMSVSEAHEAVTYALLDNAAASVCAKRFDSEEEAQSKADELSDLLKKTLRDFFKESGDWELGDDLPFVRPV